MIKQCKTIDDVNRIINYIGDKYKTTPYVYANVSKYGLGTANVKAWIDEEQEILGIYLLYFDCLHFFTTESDKYDVSKIINMHGEYLPKVLMVNGQIGERLERLFDDKYSIERNHVIDMDSVGIAPREYLSYIARREDIPGIVDLLLSDKEYYTIYSKDILLAQMLERYDDDFSRYFVVKKDGVIAATCSTYGETDNFALVGGVIVHPDFRRQGLAADVENYACHVLDKEGKSRVGFVNFLNTASLNLHEKIGAKSISSLYKFVRK